MKKSKELKDQWRVREPEVFMLFNQLAFWLPLTLLIFQITKQAFMTIFIYIFWTLSNLREYRKNKREQKFCEEIEAL